MTGLTDATEVFGITIPSTSPLFLTGVAIHVAAGIVCVVSGAVAMLSRKGRGRHSSSGSIYFWSLAVVCGLAVVLAVARWAENQALFALAVAAFAAAVVGRSAARSHRPALLSTHVVGMATSYIAMLTAFYVDNGKQLPLWRDLPPAAYWLAPGAIGLPILIHALWRHPMIRRLRDT